MVFDQQHTQALQSFPFSSLDDNGFNIALYELAHGPINYNIERLQTLTFQFARPANI